MRTTLYTRERSPFWWVRYTVDGKTVRRSTGTEDRWEAEKFAKDLERRLNAAKTGIFYKQAVLNFFAEVELRPRTLQLYRLCNRNWERFVGNLMLHEIDLTIIKNFVATRRKEMMNLGRRNPDVSIRHDLIFLSSVFSRAVLWPNGPEINPVKMFPRRHLRQAERRTRHLTDDESIRLLKASKDVDCPFFTELLVVALDTGMRKNELLTMKVKNVDLKNRRVKLDMVDTKDKEDRVVLLTQVAADTLARTLAREPVKREFVFTHPDGQPYVSIEKAWRATLKAAKIPNFHFHDLRHDFATRYLNAGGGRMPLRDQLGHASVVTSERYGHLELEAREQDFENIESTLQTHRSAVED